jgi:hypothetical protein
MLTSIKLCFWCSYASESGDIFFLNLITLLVHPSVYDCTVLVDLGRFLSVLILYTVGRTPLTGDHPIARPLSTHRITQTQNKRTQTSIPRVGFEPTVPEFERAKTVHALERAATVIGNWLALAMEMRWGVRTDFKQKSTNF